ncbi:(2Fe-2S)-binding protein [Streptomyces cellulosae]|uniref:(2Fe-2S)-binding protein n=1 Tax=Streptomyces cellulosae TaxID=1968 RepID=UPI0004C549D1|nr:2Fe-2S iron-sulfur cluster-binding protein [Streptomyces cellulosae]
MTDDQHEEGTPRSAGRWDPLPQGDYDDGATAFVKLPEGGVDALLASADSPLAAPGHGYVPPQITVTPAGGTDPATPPETGSWAMPSAAVDGSQWPDPNAVPHGGGDDRFTYNPGGTGQWHFEETGQAEGAHSAPAPGHDVTGQWSIPVAGGELPDESGEFTTSSLVEQWGGTPPATLPGGAPAPWATEAAGQPWEQPSAPADQGTRYEDGQPAAPGYEYERPTGSEYTHGRPADPASGYDRPPTDGGHGHGHGDEQSAQSWSGQERSAAAGDATAYEQPEVYGAGETVEHGRDQRAAEARAAEAFEAERHASQAHAAERHAAEARAAAERQASETRVPGAHAPDHHASDHHASDHHAPDHHTPDHHAPDHQEPQHHAPDAYEPRAYEQPGAYGQEQPAPEDHGPMEPGPAGRESEQTRVHASVRPQPLPPEQQPGEAPAETPAEAVLDASQPAHGAGEADEAAERANDAAEAVEAAERAAEAAAESTEAESEPAHAPGAAAGAESASDPAETGDGAPPHPGEEHPLAAYVLRVNGVERPVTDAWIGESLLYVLRERLGLAGAKDGCSQGECGACNVQVDGRLVASCLVPAVTAAGSEVRTVEGLAVDGQPSDVQRALAKCGAVQCGFCVPGMAMTVHDLLEGNPAPSEMETRQALCGNLCRCSGYRGVVDAVKEVVAEREAHSAADAETDADEARIPHQAGPGAGRVNPSAFEPARHDQAYGHGHGHGPAQGQDGGQA